MSICLKRTFAYLFDMVFAILVVLLLLWTPLNIKTSNYNNRVKKSENIRKEYVDIIMIMQEKYADGKLTKSEINSIITKYPKSNRFFKNYTSVTEEADYNKLIIDISTDYNNRYINETYKIEKENLGKYIISFVVCIIYFIIIPLIFKGQTLGYKLFDIKFVSNKGKRVNIFSILLRALTVNGLLLLILNYILLYLNNYIIFTKVMKSLFVIYIIFLIMCIISLVHDKKNIGLHDKICHMKVKEV